MAEYLRFQTNIPEDVALKFADGLTVSSQREGYADQVMFTLVDGRKMYVAPFAAELISKQGIEPGETFSIGKFEVTQGQRRRVEWRVTRLAAAAPEQPETQLAQDLRRSAEMARAARQGVPQPRSTPTGPPPNEPLISRRPAARPPAGPVPATAREEAEPSPIGPATRNGTSPSKTQPPTKLRMDKAMQHFLQIAGRATKKAEQTLGAEGGSVRFDSRDIAALATTLLIRAFESNWITYAPPAPGDLE